MRRPRTALLALAHALLVVAAGCSSPATVEHAAVPLPSQSAPSPATADAPLPRSHVGEPVALSARALPAKLALDGSLDDWGLEPKRNVVSVGVAPSRLVLAIGWAEEARPVVSLGLANPAPALPPIGWSQRGGTTHELTPETCEFEQIPLIEAGWQNGQRHPPEVTKACLDVLARYEKQAAAYRERFVRRLRIEGDSVALLDASGAPTPLVGAKVVARDKSVEVELPLTALPDLNQAPLTYLLGGAAFGELPEPLRSAPLQGHPSAEAPPALAEGWTRLSLDVPVGFGPTPELLAAVLTDPSGVMNGGIMSQLSYTPASPDTILTVTVPDVAVPQGKVVPKVPGAIGAPTAPDRPALAQSAEPLQRPLETFGDLEIVLAHGSVATTRQGKLVTLAAFSRPDATVRRGDDLHLFRYDEGGFNWFTGFEPPTWRVMAIRPDGTVSDEVADPGVDWPGIATAWDGTPTTFHAPDWTSFGLRGKRNGRPKAVTWRWDASARRYVVSAYPPQTYP